MFPNLKEPSIAPMQPLTSLASPGVGSVVAPVGSVVSPGVGSVVAPAGSVITPGVGSVVAPAGSIVAPAGSVVPMASMGVIPVTTQRLVPISVVPMANQSIVQAPTQSVLRVSTQPLSVPLPAPVQSIAVPAPSIPVSQQFASTNVVPMGTPMPMAGPLPPQLTPTVRTLPPRIVRNQLPPTYKQVVLPAKIVQSRLPPIGPPPTPQIPFPSSVPVPGSIQTVQSIQQIPVQSFAMPVQSVAVPSTYQSVNAIPYGTSSVGLPSSYRNGPIPATPIYGTRSVEAVSTPYGTASIGVGSPLYGSSSLPIMSTI